MLNQLLNNELILGNVKISNLLDTETTTLVQMVMVYIVYIYIFIAKKQKADCVGYEKQTG